MNISFPGVLFYFLCFLRIYRMIKVIRPESDTCDVETSSYIGNL